jgi:YggT family protein
MKIGHVRTGREKELVRPAWEGASGDRSMPTTSRRNALLLLAAVAVPAAVGLRVSPSSRPRLTVARDADVPATFTHASAGKTGAATAIAASAVLLCVVEPAAASDVAWIAPTKLVLGPLLTLGTIAFLMRVVLSWFPKYDLNELPWSLAAIPTEPILKPTRQLIPPVAGVDISPIVWVAILSFFSEILLGPQGLLTILEKKG